MISNDTVIASQKEKIDDLNQQAWEARVSDSPKAFQLSEESVKLARSINYSKGLAEGLRSLGFCYVRLFKNDEAAPLLRESLSLFQSLNDRKGQAIVYEYLGIIERNWGNLGASLELLLKGNELVHQTGPLEAEVTSCYQVGVTYKHLGNHDLALDYLYKSLSLSKEINLRLMEAYAINIIGSIYFDNGNYKDALDCYQQGLVIRQQSHDKWGEAGSLDNIGFTYLKLNDLDKAIDYCKQSLQITQSTDDKKGEANTLLHLAEIYKQAGDIGQASTFSNESLEIRKLRGDKRGEAEVLLFIADLNKNSASIADRQIFEWISVALNIAGEIKAQDLLSKAYFNLHEYYSRKGNFKESLVQLEAHLGIEKELHKNTISQKVQNLEISYKAEEIKKEAEAEKLRNKELTELNEQIEKVNEELKIEASLERVRTTAMAMKEPADMLHVCRTISDQLLQLGFKKIRNVQTVIIYPQKHEYINYQYFTPYDKSTVEIIDYRLHPDVLDFTEQMLRSPNAYYTKTFEGEELKVWREYRKQTNQLHDPKLDEATSSHYYFYSIGSGALGVTTYAPLSENEIRLFKRFRNVFELAYRRFVDIEKAQVQAREAQIEAALERVRAKSMAMHHSEDLISVINVVQEQLLGLGFHFHGANFVTDYSEKGYTMWLASPAESFPFKIYVPQIGQKYFEAVKEAIENGSDFATYTLNFEEKNIYFKNLFENSLAKNTSEEGKRKVYDSKGMAASVVLLDKIRLNLMNLDLIPFTDEENNILKRFGYVFEQSYTRFLDLQKAEAQARESQIQLAMERVRARTMAMQRSEELAEVATVLFQQVKALGVSQWVCGFNIWEIGDKEYTWYPGSPDGEILPPCKVPLTEHPVFISMDESRRRGDELFVFEKEGEFQADHYRYMMSVPGMRELLQNMLDAGVSIPSFQIDHIANFSHGSLIFITYEHVPEMHDIFKRFAKVFEQTYTRFLDLQKAEAQAREAQIEAGLERVRSKTMAMHKSEEVTGVAVSLNEELLKLGFKGGSTIIIIDKETGDTEQWTGFSENKFLKSCYVPYFKHPCHDALLNGWKKGEKFLVYTVAGDEKRSLDEHYFSTGYKDFPETDKSWMRQMESVIFSHAFTKYGAIHWGPGHLTEEQLRILQRFSIVFEQSYTRFLDLQKAEAQTKEAQTEVALERIRARAMAMHSSNELMDVANILREQMGLLDQPDLETSVVNLFEEDSELIFSWNASRVPGSSEKIINSVTSFPKNSSELTREMMSLYHSGEKEYTLEATGLKLMEFLKVLVKANPRVADYMGSKPPEKVFYHFTTFTGGNLLTVSYQPPSEETKSLQRRAASVFDMAYRRYLDLKKAEAQAREAQIEAALERVRSRSMGMHKSDELREVVGVLFAQLQHLGIDIKFCSIALIDKSNSTIEFWLSGFSQEILPESYHVPNLDHPFYRNFQNVFQQGIPYHVFELYGEEKKSYDKLWFTLTEFKSLPEPVKKPMMEMERVVLSCAFTKNGMIQIGGFEPLAGTDASIVQRFAKVFEQTHTRFLDLQKAEAQAREAQVEAALERVRAKVMAMTNSNDLNETSLVFGEQLRKLGIDWQFSYFWLVDEPRNENTFWITWPDYKTSLTSYTLAEAEEYFNDCLVSWRAGVKIHDNYVAPEGVKEWLYTFQRIADDAGGEAKRVMVPQTFANGVYYYDAMMKYGSFGICISKPATDEEKNIQCRFAIEFERAYTRFLDLQKAEAQARESQIELGLERVRARAMAMQRSDELAELVDTVFKELTKLHFTLDRCIIIIIDENSRSANYWMANPESITPTAYHLQLKDIPLLNATFNAWKERTPKMVYDLVGDEKSSTVEYIFSKTELKLLPAEVREGMKNTDRIFLNISFNNFGGLQADTIEPLTEENLDILYRFSKVFDLTYTRFNDLRQAEAQTREAQIELGLERVRARAMAMQNSGELKELITTVSTELSKLDLILDRCFIMTYDIKTLGVTWWMANPETPSEPIDLYVKYHEQIPYLAFLKAWQDRIVKFQYILEGSVKKNWDEFLFVETELSRLPRFVIDNMRANDKVYLSASFNNFGCLTLATLEPLSDEQFDIMLRFAKVFDLTYTRFNDLKQAEAQARAAKIEAALERVRARALAMQEPEELKDVAHVLRTEMGLLGVEELETCSIYINDLGAEKAECWYALKDAGSEEMKLVNDHFALNLNDTWVGREMLQFYNADTKQISIVMTGDNRKEWIQYCEQNSIPLRGYYGAVIPDRTYHLYKFSHGAIGVATPGEISAESWDLLKRAASVFSLAYSRFKDLTQARTDLIKLKEEKKRAEDALTELQVTQKQLIQSEKMASLGELTAGIAHEIQNPLNFVNNFSDVSNELLEEMKTELATGNTQQAIEMVNAVKDNLEKILHHGQRADAIVKSMLQHSRSSTGKKEPTDINSLAEEYFRLAFHGLRAKDKSFNAKFETDLDKSIGKVNIISQDVGRVILNLINNAFYAVNEKKNKNANGYEPVVAVSTRKVNDKVEIRVKDNGDGIPQKVLDKIFQPFFTTKPTGQGTGLGLSLSYDIITKGHGGELFVKTKEGEGTEFIISLPVN